MQCDVPSPESMLADHAQRNRTGRSAAVVDLLKSVNRRGNAFHSRLQLQGQKLRVVARLVQVTAMEPKPLLLWGLPHISLLTFPGARVFGRIRAQSPDLAHLVSDFLRDQIRGPAVH